MDKIFLAQQANRALQLFAQNMNLSETEALEIADLYEPWEIRKKYPVGKVLKYGLNQWQETQLYSVVQEHTSQENWKPDGNPALYKAIGFKNDIPIWTQPLGGHDAYSKGDVVSYNDKTWTSDYDGNVWQPGVYGWSIKP